MYINLGDRLSQGELFLSYYYLKILNVWYKKAEHIPPYLRNLFNSCFMSHRPFWIGFGKCDEWEHSMTSVLIYNMQFFFNFKIKT